MNELADRFTAATGSPFYLTADDPERIEAYLQQLGYLIHGERVVAVAPAGEGNMNVTLRVMTSRHRFILKQSRPWVAKFPQLDAPVERILVEHSFHRAIVTDRYLANKMPELLKADEKNYVLLLEDLGDAGDLTTVYQQDDGMSRGQLATLLEFAGKLHRRTPADFPANDKLKTLNHAHIFDLPLRADNGFPLDAIYPGLARVAQPYQHDEALRRVVAGLGARYLATGTTLIHGDFYPGSFLDAEDGLYVIDAEFAHLGRPEFDIGVLMAHLLMSRASEKRILQIDTDYGKPPGFEVALARQFCYVEIIRRIIGIAQLPLSLTLDERSRLLERARAGLV
ncbi:Methylthioribose kinase [Neolewinella maritima]|uniref:Methylthioribose kinase n=1 Tax=Neolewinella maritima TaxID=1383882 RepID=A0ABM9B541_9BACT|nr:phosphotransferase [Neolewinella maritima]CAH1002495.1 Methylthioribose kinase [Neolewinella maritima]